MNDNINITPDCLKYIQSNIVSLDLPFILTTDKKLVTGMPYLYSEGSNHTAVRLIEAWHIDEMVYLTVQELHSDKSFTISWNMEYDGDYWMWSIADLPSIMNMSK